MNKILKAVLLTLVLTSFTSGPMFRSQNKPEVILYTDFVSLDFEPNGGSTSVNITCNTTWSTSYIGGFITRSPISGSGNGQITITTTNNELIASREGTVTITAGSKSVVINIYQYGSL